VDKVKYKTEVNRRTTSSYQGCDQGSKPSNNEQ